MPRIALCTSEDVTSFLEQIGRNNASYILHIYIEFPEFHYLDLHDVTLENDCAKFGTLTTSLYSTNAIEMRLDALDYPKIVAEALALVDACFRAILSLQEIIVKVYEDGPSDRIRREMKNHGWTITVYTPLQSVQLFKNIYQGIPRTAFCFLSFGDKSSALL